MDSGDRSVNRVKASESGMGGLRSQSFSNLFQGFFGIPHAPTSANDIPSLEKSNSANMRSLDTIVSPSNDDSFILSQFLTDRREREDDVKEVNLGRNATWSNLGKFEGYQLTGPSLTVTSETGVMRKVGHEQIPYVDISNSRMTSASATELEHLAEKSNEECMKPKIIFAKNAERSNYPKGILSSFLMHDKTHGDLEPRQNETNLKRSSSLENNSILSGTAPGTMERDQVDRGVFPLGAPSSEQATEPKHTIKDLLWSFNHEKIKVSKKEMNLIASIDQ